jgi:L-fuculose-phosphate aldolase
MHRSEQQHREDIVQVGRMMYERGWIAGSDGNLSVRLDADRILATPTGMCKGRMNPEDLLICDNAGNKISGERERTTEMAMHVAVYQTRPDIHAVVHAHPPIATGFAVAGRALNMGIMPELIVSLGSVPLADYGLPGTPALVDGMLPFVAKFDAILLANHGAVAYGTDIHRAFARMETIEHLARITLVAEMLGGPKVLPRNEVQKLFEARRRYGVHVPNEFEPGNPLTAEDMPDPNDKLEFTRQQLMTLIDEALRVRG